MKRKRCTVLENVLETKARVSVVVESRFCGTRGQQRGHKEAMEELGFCYQRGIGVKKDLSIAAEWYEKAGMHDKANRLRNGEDEFAFDVFPSHRIPYLEEVDGLIPFPEMDMDNPF